MKTNKEKVNDLLKFVSNMETLYATESKNQVKLFVRGSGGYVVRFKDNRPDREFEQPALAIKCYEENGGRLI